VINLLRYFSLRHFFRSPLRTALTFIGVAVGVATLVGITSINRSVMDAFRSTIDTISGKADLTVAAEQMGLSEDVLEQVRNTPGVLHASGSISVTAPVKNQPGEKLYIIGVDLLDDGFFRTYESSDTDMGKLGDDLEFLNSTDRLMLSERFAKDKKLKVGDSIELVTSEGVKPFFIHGLLKETGPIKAFGGSVAVMFFGSLQEAFSKGRTLSRIDVSIDKSIGLFPMKERLRTALGPQIEVDEPERRGASVETMLRSFQLGLNLGSAVALLVGIFLVYNTVSIGVVQRRREIGTLRALGSTKRAIRLLFTLEAAIVGFLGSLLGLPLGIAIAKLALGQVSQTISSIYVQVNAKDVNIGSFELMVGLSMGVLGSVFAALRPAWVASGVQPVEALRKDAAMGAGSLPVRSWPTYLGVTMLLATYPVSKLPAPVENLPLGGYLAIFLVLMGVTLLSPQLLRALNVVLQKIGTLFFGISGRMAADNFSRAPLRTAVPVSALSIGVTMAITIASFVGSFQKSSEEWLHQAVPADLFVTSSGKLAGIQTQTMLSSWKDEMKQIEGVADVDPVRIFHHDVLGLRIFIIALTASIYEVRGKPIILDGALPTETQRKNLQVVVSENFARKRNLSVGSTFDLNTPNGVKQLTVATVIIDYTSDQGTIVIDRPIFDALFNDDKADTFHVYVKDIKDLESVRASITEKLGKKIDLYVMSNSELREEAHKIISDTFAITYAMEFIAVVLALLGVINTLLAAVLDRTREIGLMRGIGAGKKHVIEMFSAEAFFMGIVGGTLGLCVGGIVGFILTKVVGLQATGWDFPFYYPWPTAITMLIAATLSSVLAGLYPARRAANLNVVEALAWE
jgi:putative ABC transport system permease protein